MFDTTGFVNAKRPFDYCTEKEVFKEQKKLNGGYSTYPIDMLFDAEGRTGCKYHREKDEEPGTLKCDKNQEFRCTKNEGKTQPEHPCSSKKFPRVYWITQGNCTQDGVPDQIGKTVPIDPNKPEEKEDPPKEDPPKKDPPKDTGPNKDDPLPNPVQKPPPKMDSPKEDPPKKDAPFDKEHVELKIRFGYLSQNKKAVRALWDWEDDFPRTDMDYCKVKPLWKADKPDDKETTTFPEKFGPFDASGKVGCMLVRDNDKSKGTLTCDEKSPAGLAGFPVTCVLAEGSGGKLPEHKCKGDKDDTDFYKIQGTCAQ